MTEPLKISDIARAAQGQWGSIFPALGITVPVRGKHGACPVCGGKDRFHFDDKEGRFFACHHPFTSPRPEFFDDFINGTKCYNLWTNFN